MAGSSFCGGGDGSIKVWEAATGAAVRTLEGHTSTVTALAVRPGDGLLFSGSGDSTLRLWELATGTPVRTVDVGGWVSALSLCGAGGEHVLTAAGWGAGVLALWSAADGARVCDLRGHTVGGLAVSVSVSWDGTLRVWDLESGECLREVGARAFAVAVTAGGQMVVGGGDDDEDGVLAVWASPV